MALRVIAGSRKGHKLAAPRGHDTRPTSDRVRENIFNLVGPVDGARVLDLFAGSGALGIEALSRGATSAVFVERDPDAVRTIERNLDKLRLTGARVVHGDVLHAIAQEATAGAKYDLVLVDPPYGMLNDIQSRLARHLPLLLAANGLLVVETDARTEPELGLTIRTSRKYGQTRVTLFEAGGLGPTEPPGSGGAGVYGAGAGNP
jgi:16S rRNA (guanine966-N2)-methyltransferase